MNCSLEPIKEEDYLQFYELLNSNRSRLRTYFPTTIKDVETIEDSKRHLRSSDEKRGRKEKYLLGIYTQDQLVGYINIKNIDWGILKCELGYFIDKEYEGKGVMTNQIRQAIKYCFDELKLLKIFLRIGKENIGSQTVALKTGFKKEGVLRNEFRLQNGELIDVEYYGILSENC